MRDISTRYLHGWKQDFKSLGRPLLSLGNAVSFLDRTVLLFQYFLLKIMKNVYTISLAALGSTTRSFSSSTFQDSSTKLS